MDKLTSMRAFTRVVQHGSFAAAARELRLSRSVVSKYVIELELELGSQLLVRTTRSASPTQNGQAYYERCLAILADLEEADLAVMRLQSEPRGVLRVHAPMSVGTLRCHLAGRCGSAVIEPDRPQGCAGVARGLRRAVLSGAPRLAPASR